MPDSPRETVASGGMLPAGHAMVLGMAAAGAPLGSILRAVTELVEMDDPGLRCSVMLLDDDGRLRLAAGPRIPAGYAKSLEGGVPVAPEEGSCGAALATGRPVVVSDIGASPNWRRYAPAAVADGLHACWSVPIVGAGERPLGTFAMYYDDCQEPAPAAIQQLSGFAQLIAVAVQQDGVVRALEHATRFDPLTGLPDRGQLHLALDEALARRRAGQWVAVAAVELRRLRECNEAYGFRAGDELIVQAANRLRALLGGDGHLFRTGGSGFTVILHDQAEVTPRTLPERFLMELSAAMTVAGATFVPSPRIGMAVTADRLPWSAAELLEGAQVALREARGIARPALVVADERSQGRTARQLRQEDDLRRALAADELVLHYQPQYALRTGRMSGVEALVRWDHPERGLLFPGAFLDTVDAAGLHTALLHHLLGRACRDAAGWNAADPTTPITVAVNLFPQDLHGSALVETVDSVLKTTGLPGRLLCLEVTEQAALLDMDAATDALRELKALGVRIAMDDFGTGYSSLAYARRLPIDTLKIDRSFVQRITTSAKDAAVVAAVVRLAEGLDMEVLAEGIETDAQRHLLADLGCHSGQGYLWSRAVPPAMISGLLAAGVPACDAEPADVEGPSSAPVAAVLDDTISSEARRLVTLIQHQVDLLARDSADPTLADTAEEMRRQLTALDAVLATIDTSTTSSDIG